MYALNVYVVTLVLSSILAAFGQNLVLTNDDGWAVAQIRAQFEALDDAGFEVCSYTMTFRVFTYSDIVRRSSCRRPLRTCPALAH